MEATMLFSWLTASLLLLRLTVVVATVVSVVDVVLSHAPSTGEGAARARLPSSSSSFSLVAQATLGTHFSSPHRGSGRSTCLLSLRAGELLGNSG